MSKPIEQFLIEWRQAQPGRDKPGYAVVVLGSRAPTVVHDNIESAEKEAKRIIGTLPDNMNQTVLVLSVVSAVTRMKASRPPIEVVRLAASSPPTSVDRDAVRLGLDQQTLYIGEKPVELLGCLPGAPAKNGTWLCMGSSTAPNEAAGPLYQAAPIFDWPKDHAPDLTAPIVPASFPAPKFKPGDRVCFISEFDGKTYYGIVCEPHAEEALRRARGDKPVFAIWDSGGYAFMPEDRVFRDLRTVAGGGHLTLKEGMRGKTRNGQIFGPIRFGHGGDYPMRGRLGETDRYCTREGFHLVSRESNPLDIVELLPHEDDSQ